MTNRLAQESSPYLRQHQENPVDWYPWGEEALQRARSEDKPILLSVGYSACHWCHVMAHECFENSEIAALMNEKFINIKVDREERPDLDQIYQNVAQAITQGGGWPLTVFLTPELQPYFGGTYFPPEDRWGRPGFPRVLDAMANAYRNDRLNVTENAGRLLEYIRNMDQRASAQRRAPSVAGVAEAMETLLTLVDLEKGGLKGAPKFPNPMAFSFLWRAGNALKHEGAKNAARIALDQMAQGGIFDQLGGGFHRYSVDDTWSVPHFEKMLYDNGLLLKLYSEVYCAEKKSQYLRVIRDTVEYLLREMRSPEGAFYSAQDADTEGEEGKTFVWDLRDLQSAVSENVITEGEARIFARTYGVTESGNFEHGKTVLFLAHEPEPGSADAELLRSARRKLFEVRSARPMPGIDNKVLCSWNGLVISGLSWASRALSYHSQPDAEVSVELEWLSDSALESAWQTFECVRARMETESPQGFKRLSSTLQQGEPKGNGFLDDYAFMAMGALDLARALPSRRQKDIELAITSARSWIQTVLKHFSGDPSRSAYYFTSDDHEELIHRPSSFFDGPIPNGTAVVIECMMILEELGYSVDPGRTAALDEEVAMRLGALFPAALRAPHGLGELLCAALLNLQGPVVLSGVGVEKLCGQANFFRKLHGEDTMSFTVCHRRTCSSLMKNLEELKPHLPMKTWL